MSIMPVYFSTTSTKKRKQKSVSVDEIRKHEKYLRKMGIDSDKPKQKPKILKSDYVKEEYVSLTPISYTPTLDNSYKLKESAKFDIGQTYNKSGFQVLCKFDKSDSSLGKRR